MVVQPSGVLLSHHPLLVLLRARRHVVSQDAGHRIDRELRIVKMSLIQMNNDVLDCCLTMLLKD